MQLTHIRQLDVSGMLASGHAHVSAASGLVHLGDTLYVIADDENHLALFTHDDVGPGKLLRLLPGDLPRKKKKRKAVKPDFEMLFQLSTVNDEPSDWLYAFGSGSTPQRMRGARIHLASGDVSPLDLEPLFTALAPLVSGINVEGAVVRGDRLLLFNRGNMANPETCILETGLGALAVNHVAEAVLVKKLALPMIGNVPLTVTDACALDDGMYLLSAVAEVTDDSYADGDILGSAIVMLNADFEVVALEHLEPVIKIEGISARRSADGIELLCVSDADDPDTASSLWFATLPI